MILILFAKFLGSPIIKSETQRYARSYLNHELSCVAFNINSINFNHPWTSVMGRPIKKSTNLFDVCSLFNFVVDHLIKEFDWFSPDFIIVHEGYWHVWIQIIFIIRDFLWFQNIPFFQKNYSWSKLTVDQKVGMVYTWRCVVKFRKFLDLKIWTE